MQRSTIALLTATLVCAAAAPALAQPPPADPTVVPNAPAASGGGRSGLGLGVAAMLFGGPGGPSVAWDAGNFHIDSMFFVSDPGEPKTDFGLGARFWWHLHTAAAADFSLGAGVGYRHDGGDRNGNGEFDQVNIEGGMQIRAFIASNVALNATAGLSVATADAEGFGITGQFLGSFGLHYYFF